jgi:hypothetical protein
MRLGSAVSSAWARLRHWSGDDAYERYLAEHARLACGHAPLDRRAFYRDYFRQRASRPRCC